MLGDGNFVILDVTPAPMLSTLNASAGDAADACGWAGDPALLSGGCLSNVI